MKVSRERKKVHLPFKVVLRSYLAVAVIFVLFLLALAVLVVVERFIIG
jgi:hypothetical protein